MEAEAVASTKSRRKRMSKSLKTRVILASAGLDGKPRCTLCGKTLKRDEVTMDHIIRIADGGPTTFENLRAACGPCNSSRHAARPDAARRKAERRIARRAYAAKPQVGTDPLGAAISFWDLVAAQKQDEDRLATTLGPIG